MSTIFIPLDGDEQDREIIEDFSIAIERGWRLGARIHARCAPARDGRPSKQKPSDSEGISKLNFSQLSRKTGRSLGSISAHWHNWQDAIDQGIAQPAIPGEHTELPDPKVYEYPPTGNGGGNRDVFTSETSAEEKIVALTDMMHKDQEFAQAVDDAYMVKVMTPHTDLGRRVERAFIQKAGEDVELFGKVSRQYEEHHPVPAPTYHPPLAIEVIGTTSLISGGAEREAHKNLPKLLDFLRQHAENPSSHFNDDVQEELDGLARLRELTHEWGRQIRVAAGWEAEPTVSDNEKANLSRLLDGVEL